MRGFHQGALIAMSVAAFVCASEAATRQGPSVCTYEMQVWNVESKGSIHQKEVRHPYSELRSEEIDSATGCTVCREDQEPIEIPTLASFSVCYKIAPRVREVFSDLVRKGAPIHTVVGYHVIKSRGAADKNGNRTGFSNHSFGTAFDINSEQNGLYDNCVAFNSGCRLLRGGAWRPGTPGTLARNSDIVLMFKQSGFRWGGEIAGKQKNFMHFSLTGD